MDGRTPRPASTTPQSGRIRRMRDNEQRHDGAASKTVKAGSRMEPKMHVAAAREQPSSRLPTFPGARGPIHRASGEKGAGGGQSPYLGHAREPPVVKSARFSG